MITANQLVPIGQTGKPHGVKGEIVCFFPSDNFDAEKNDFLVFDIDGIFVPFFICEYRKKRSSSLLIKFDGIDSEEQVQLLSGKKIFIPIDKQMQKAKEIDLSYFVGFRIHDTTGNLGTIDQIDDSTTNALFVVGDKLIPIADEFITEIDYEQRILYTCLPEGLLNL